MTTIKAIVTFRKLRRDEIIKEGDYHSLGKVTMLYPCISPCTIGDKPSSFAMARSFWRQDNKPSRVVIEDTHT